MSNCQNEIIEKKIKDFSQNISDPFFFLIQKMINSRFLNDEEEKERRKIEFRRKADQERKKRFFNEKIRLFGIDKKGIEVQKKEKEKERKEEEKEKKKMEKEILKHQEVLKKKEEEMSNVKKIIALQIQNENKQKRLNVKNDKENQVEHIGLVSKGVLIGESQSKPTRLDFRGLNYEEKNQISSQNSQLIEKQKEKKQKLIQKRKIIPLLNQEKFLIEKKRKYSRFNNKNKRKKVK
ncbi:hypothetical protein M0811_07238 [Anaeramoeba ignava]|uniref:Uncharacterized protein n=1 Tax=Anaeramoeba ignava TaxID=1746090 RepID=A0A9Q0LLG8_ANAIG|nr:hypothetical protein M0811_07238 [Anaeramoeba ignava]